MTGAPAGSPRLVGVSIRKYKNLRDVFMPWSDGVALFGVNGAGKTNILECLALLLGSTKTLQMAAPRLVIPDADDLAVLAAPGPDALPWPPRIVRRRESGAAQVPDFPGMARVSVDADWWGQVGTAASGVTVAAGLIEAGLPQSICDLVASQATDPVIRYRLTGFDLASQQVRRTYSPTLMARGISDVVLRAAKGLPAPFAPLETQAGRPAEAGGWFPVMDLPQVDRAPATLQWLPRGRTNEEVDDDLQEALDAARARVPELTGLLGEELPFTIPLTDGDWHWLCHEISAEAAERELVRTLPEVHVVAAGGTGNFADFALVAGGDERSHTGDGDALEPFSAGQRRWIDEALATSARELTRFAERAQLYADVYVEADEFHLRSAAAAVTLPLRNSWRTPSTGQVAHSTG